LSRLSKRQEMILGLIVREYVQRPTPVGSKVLVDVYLLDVSSATVRNDMAVLEEAGLIAAPHTSAGRIPTEEGYRYFVRKLMGDVELSVDERRLISHQFHQASTPNVEEMLRLASSVLANTVRTASLVTSPQVMEATFKHLELISTQGRIVLMVLVLEGGAVRQQMLSLAEPVTQDQLSEVAARISQRCVGMTAEQLQAAAMGEPTLDQEVLGLAADLTRRASTLARVAYVDGLVNMLDPDARIERLDVTPEEREDLSRALAIVDSEGARQALHLLEEQSLLEEILTEALMPGPLGISDVPGVQVMIAGEGRWEELSHASMVLSRYGAGRAIGALGVLGPTRLHYGRAISAVRYVAGLMSDLLIDVYGGQEGN